jgi:EAL domain-containing protein (putative c-di-GMP-specific phosphodiesterase class I)
MAKPPAPTNDILTTGLAERIIPLEVRPVVDLATSAPVSAVARLGGVENCDGRDLERFAELQGRRRELLIYMIERAARHIKAWRTRGFSGSLLMNLPPRLIEDRTLATSFDVISKSQAVEQSAFTVLVPQTEYLKSGSEALTAMWRLRKAGCGVAMSIDAKSVAKFARPREHPFSAIALGGHHAWKRLKTIGPGKLGATGSWLGWAESLGLRRIAFSISDESERETARLYGFNLGEGSHFADYMPARAFIGETETTLTDAVSDRGLPPPPTVISLKRA